MYALVWLRHAIIKGFGKCVNNSTEEIEMLFQKSEIEGKSFICDTMSHMSEIRVYGVGPAMSYFERGVELGYAKIATQVLEKLMDSVTPINVFNNSSGRKLIVRSGSLSNCRLFLQNLINSHVLSDYICIEATVTVNRQLNL
jgi:hypothetical protein